MKIGDLVKYDKSLSGLHNCLGLVVGFNGAAIVVEWIDRHALTHTGIYRHALPSGRPSHTERSVEMPEFLEVISTT